MTGSPELPDVEITTDNFADFLPDTPAPLAEVDAHQPPATPTADDLSDEEVLALVAEDIEAEDTLTDDAAMWPIALEEDSEED